MPRAPGLVLILLAPALLAGCASTTNEPADVIATFYPLGWLAGELAADDLTVATLVPPGVEPHDWEPTTGDVARIAQAKLLVVQGAGFEPWLDGLLATLGDKAPPVVVTTRELDLAAGEAHAHDETHDEEHGEVHDEAHEEAGHDAEANETHEGEEADALDPHTWLDPVLFGRQAATLRDAMVTAFPEHADAIRARAAQTQDELAQLDRDFASGLRACDIDVVVANHDAYGYMARRYGFEVVAISGLSPEAEPSPRALERAIHAAREHNVTVIFFEDLVSPRVADIVAREVGATTRVLSPVEGLPRDAPAGTDYLTLMRQNLANLREAMRCE